MDSDNPFKRFAKDVSARSRQFGRDTAAAMSSGYRRARVGLIAFCKDLPDRSRRIWSGFVLWLKKLSLTARIILGAAVALVVGVFIFLAQPNWDWARPTVSSIVSARLNRPVTIEGPLRVHLFSFTPAATASGLKVGQPQWAIEAEQKDPVATIERLHVRVEFLPLFTGRIVLPRLEIDKPIVRLFQDRDGRMNWDFSDGKAKGDPLKLPLIKNFIIRDGDVELNSLSRKLTFAGTVNAREQAGSGNQAFQLTGDGNLNGRVFEMEAGGGPLLNVNTSRPYPFVLKVQAGNTVMTANGRVIRPFDLGHLSGDVKVKGRNLADLYYITGLTFPNTPAYTIAAQVTRDDRVYGINGIDGRIGGSDIAGTLKVELRAEGRPYLTGDLSSRVLNFEDLGALFGASSANAPQAAEVSATPSTTVSARRLLPDAPLDVQRVRGMDADVNYTAGSVKAGPNLPLREVTLGVKLDRGLMTLDPIAFKFPQGQLTGVAEINAREEVQVNTVDFRLSKVRIQDFVPDFQGSAPIEGLMSARFKATGTGNSVHDAAASANGELAIVMPGGRIRQTLAELMGVNPTTGLFGLISKSPKETAIRCGVGHFDLKDGVMNSRAIVMDTEVVRLDGKGRINLKTERVDIELKGKPKKFRLFRLHVPLIVGGSLAQPKFSIDAKPALLQGGLAVLLGNVLPFIGVEYAENANCAALGAGE